MRGNPVSGIIPSIAPILVNDCQTMSITIPTPKSPAKGSVTRRAIWSPLRANKRNRIIIAEPPTNPNSCAATAKIESPVGSGSDPNFWILCPKPRPVIPPDQITVSDF